MVSDLRAAREQSSADLTEKVANYLASQDQFGQPAETEAACPAMTPEDADRARRDYARRSIADFLDALRTALEPEPANIPELAEVIARVADLLRQSAAAPEAAPLLDKALEPAARTAVTLAAFVNGPVLANAPQEHAGARAEAECWPRIHYANATRNTEADELFRSFRIGAGRPHRTAKQTRPAPHSTAFDDTLGAMLLLLPDALRPGVFPVLPLLLDEAGRPIPPRTADGELAKPYLDLARFLVTIRHTPPNWKEARKKAVRDFLALNDAKLGNLPRGLRNAYQRTRASLNGPPPKWLRSSSPYCIGSNTSKDRARILRPERLQILADALLPIYSRTLAELEARHAIKTVIDLRYKITGRGITGPKSAAADYVAPHLEKLRQLPRLPEAALRIITSTADAEAAKLKAEAVPS